MAEPDLTVVIEAHTRHFEDAAKRVGEAMSRAARSALRILAWRDDWVRKNEWTRPVSVVALGLLPASKVGQRRRRRRRG